MDPNMKEHQQMSHSIKVKVCKRSYTLNTWWSPLNVKSCLMQSILHYVLCIFTVYLSQRGKASFIIILLPWYFKLRTGRHAPEQNHRWQRGSECMKCSNSLGHYMIPNAEQGQTFRAENTSLWLIVGLWILAQAAFLWEDELRCSCEEDSEWQR